MEDSLSFTLAVITVFEHLSVRDCRQHILFVSGIAYITN